MIKYKMDNGIAFDLGAFNYQCFCDTAAWIPNKEPFDYAHFFEWRPPLYHDVWVFHGHLDESKFETLEHKYYYIKGRLSSYSVGIKDDSITVYYANSIKSRDRFVKWAKELIIFKFGKDAVYSIETEDGLDTMPYTPSLVLKAGKEIIEYFKGGDYERISKQDTQ